MSPTRLNTTTISLLLGDILIFSSSLVFALIVRNLAIPEATFFVQHIYPFSVLLLMWIALFIIGGMYDQTYLTIKRSIGSTLITLQLVGGALATLMFYTIPTFAITPKTNLALFLIIFSILIWIWRYVFFWYVRPISQRALLVGEHDPINRLLSKENMFGIVITNQIDWKELRGQTLEGVDVLLVDQSHPSFIKHAEFIQQNVMNGLRILDVHHVEERVSGKVPLSTITPYWFISHVKQPARSYLFMKRLTDLVAGLILVLAAGIIAPFLFLASLITERRSDIFFSQERVGSLGSSFVMYKFRTMHVRDHTSWSGSNHQYVTTLGKILRALRIDELPQGLNLIKGEMSLVGPRALMPSEQEKMEGLVPAYSQRLFAKPGITGWAQINQTHAPRDEKEAAERLSYDLYYLVHSSFLFDTLIMLKTVKTVLLRTGMRQ